MTRRKAGSLAWPPLKDVIDRGSVVTTETAAGVGEIKKWQAITDYLRGLPAPGPDELPIIPVDERAREVRVIKVESGAEG